jgi:hypothetical protein
MANVRIGSHSSHDYEVVEKITEAKQLTWNDSGKLFFCEQGSAYVVNLPKLSEEIAGWQAKFILTDTVGSNIEILVNEATAANTPATATDLNKVIYLEMTHAGMNSNTGNPADGIKFSSSAADSDGGTIIQIHTDGIKWYVHGVGDTANALGAVG